MKIKSNKMGILKTAVVLFSLATIGGPVESKASTLGDVAGLPGMDMVTGSKYLVKPINIFRTVEWDIFLDTFEITGWGTCPDWPIPDFGIDVRMIEVTGFAETTKQQWHFPFLGLDLGSPLDVFTKGASRENKSEDAGNQGGRGDIMYSHYIKFPIFAMIPIFSSIFCFDNLIPFVYFSEIDPSHKLDYMDIYVQPARGVQKALTLNPAGLVSTVVDCAASEGVNMSESFGGPNVLSEYGGPLSDVGDSISGITSGLGSAIGKAKKFLNLARDSMVYADGCSGFSTSGGYGPAKDPANHHDLIIGGMMDKITTLMYTGVAYPAQFWKQTEMYYIPASSMCWPLPAPHFLKSQYVFQRAGWPSVGEGHMPGTSPLHQTGSNIAGSGDAYVTFTWKYRDYRAFAYKCI